MRRFVAMAQPHGSIVGTLFGSTRSFSTCSVNKVNKALRISMVMMDDDRVPCWNHGQIGKLIVSAPNSRFTMLKMGLGGKQWVVVGFHSGTMVGSTHTQLALLVSKVSKA